MIQEPETNIPTVTFDLPPILEAYCRFALEIPVDQEIITVNRTNDIGKALSGFLTKTKLKTKLPLIINPVTFTVPVTRYNYYSLQSNFFYISAENQQQIEDVIEVLFNCWLDVFFSDGYKMNLTQLDIIECVLDVLNIRMNAANFDQIKKRDYRKGKSDIRVRSQLILKQRLSAVSNNKKYFSHIQA